MVIGAAVGAAVGGVEGKGWGALAGGVIGLGAGYVDAHSNGYVSALSATMVNFEINAFRGKNPLVAIASGALGLGVEKASGGDSSSGFGRVASEGVGGAAETFLANEGMAAVGSRFAKDAAAAAIGYAIGRFAASVICSQPGSSPGGNAH
jgi:hypothetical protein